MAGAHARIIDPIYISVVDASIYVCNNLEAAPSTLHRLAHAKIVR